MYKLLIIPLCLFIPLALHAGNISSTDYLAWGDKTGWVNFSPTNGNVNVTSSGITGYAWIANFGWLNMNPTNGGVLNDGQGNLSGFAWGEQIGWVDFDGVSINSSGLFSGQATSSVAGTITFSCSNCLVTTTWRAASLEGASGSSRKGSSHRTLQTSKTNISTSIDFVKTTAVEPEILKQPVEQMIQKPTIFSKSMQSKIPSDTNSGFVATTYPVATSSLFRTSSMPVETASTTSMTEHSIFKEIFKSVSARFISIWNIFGRLFK